MNKRYTIEQLRKYARHVGSEKGVLVGLTDLMGLHYLLLVMYRHKIISIDEYTMTKFLGAWYDNSIDMDVCEQIVVKAKQDE